MVISIFISWMWRQIGNLPSFLDSPFLLARKANDLAAQPEKEYAVY